MNQTTQQRPSRPVEQLDSFDRNGKTFLSRKSSSCSPQFSDIYRLIRKYFYSIVGDFFFPLTSVQENQAQFTNLGISILRLGDMSQFSNRQSNNH